MRKLILMTAAACLACTGLAQAAMINEFVANDSSTDDHEFIELCGNPGESLDGLAIFLIEGESSAGTIDRIIDLNGYALGASGKFLIGDPNVNPDLEMAPGWIENGGNNILLVMNWNASVGDDIDTDDDCVEDVGVSIGEIVDGIGYGNVGDCINYFGIPSIGPDGIYDPAGGARCDDCAGDWNIICLDGTEPGGGPCLGDDGYLVPNATPGEVNACTPVADEPESWGSLKSMYR